MENAAKLSFDDASFDLVISQNVFHHIPDWESAVREVARVLRPGGVFIWFDPALPRWMERLLRPIARSYGLYTFSETNIAFEAAGFRRRFYEHVRHGPFVHHHLVLHKP